MQCRRCLKEKSHFSLYFLGEVILKVVPIYNRLKPLNSNFNFGFVSRVVHSTLAI